MAMSHRSRCLRILCTLCMSCPKSISHTLPTTGTTFTPLLLPLDKNEAYLLFGSAPLPSSISSTTWANTKLVSGLQCGREFGWIVSNERSAARSPSVAPARSPSAVPQGSTLGSTQSNIFTNDLADGGDVLSEGSQYQPGAWTMCWRTHCSSGCRKDPAKTSWSSAQAAEELFCWR